MLNPILIDQKGRWTRRMVAAVMLSLIFLLFFCSVPFAVTDIASKAEITADPILLKSVLASFERAEKALQKEQLPELMQVYSEDYENRGLRKDIVGAIWKDIFARYTALSSRHLFSKIVVDAEKGRAAITCTGALFGVPVLTGGTKAKAVHIDFWFEAIHYLVLEQGTWKIIGHDPSAGEGKHFGSAIHLLF